MPPPPKEQAPKRRTSVDETPPTPESKKTCLDVGVVLRMSGRGVLSEQTVCVRACVRDAKAVVALSGRDEGFTVQRAESVCLILFFFGTIDAHVQWSKSCQLSPSKCDSLPGARKTIIPLEM